MISEQEEPAALQNKVIFGEENYEKNSSETLCQDKKTYVVKTAFIKESSSTNGTLLNQDNMTREEKGIVYISRVPCFMNAIKLRQYMENFGKIRRIFLTPENSVERKKRLRAGGSKKTMFKDGWIEFEKKKVAKFVGNHLNNTPVGGPKRHNFWREDIWNLRYLSKFQWHHLLEYHTGKKKAREVSRALELEQMRRENTHYLEQVEKKRKKELIALNQLNKKKKEANCS